MFMGVLARFFNHNTSEDNAHQDNKNVINAAISDTKKNTKNNTTSKTKSSSAACGSLGPFVYR